MSDAKTTPTTPMHFVPGYDYWQRSMHDNLDRMKAFYDEYAKLEEATLGHARSNMAEGARMLTETMNYQAKLSSEWRKLAFEATKRTMEMLTPHSATTPTAGH
jgi:hypothetical protein